jgi:hypothetical protein
MAQRCTDSLFRQRLLRWPHRLPAPVGDRLEQKLLRSLCTRCTCGAAYDTAYQPWVEQEQAARPEHARYGIRSAGLAYQRLIRHGLSPASTTRPGYAAAP